MTVKVVFKNLDRSNALVDFIEKKSEGLMRFLNPSAHITYYVEKLAHGLKVMLSVDEQGCHYQAATVKSNAYDGIGGVNKRLSRQLSDKHDRMNRIHNSRR